MPKQNQIPYFVEATLAGGTIVWHWKPSPRLRRAGWANLRLGDNRTGTRKAALMAAMTRNEELDRWEAARTGDVAAPAPKRVRLRWRDLLDRYKRDPEAYLSKKPKTRAEYDSRLRTLTRWAVGSDGEEGGLLLSDLSRQHIMQLRETLLLDGRKHRTAALLRVLGILLTFGANKGLLPLGLGEKLQIPSPPKRTRRLLRDELAPLIDAAHDLKLPHIALGITLGFYTLQREGDLLATTSFRLRPIEDISPGARRVLAGPDGKVMGLHLEQAKTGANVAIALAPMARGAVEEALAKDRPGQVVCTHLILYPNEDRACPDWKFQRDFRATVTAATNAATERQDHALAAKLAGIQFRDLRRSGMCWMRDLTVPVALIAANSGHSIDQTQKILDTYMPRDTRAAAEGMAMAVAAQAERDAAEVLAKSEPRT